MNNIHISYYFYKENPYVIDHVYANTVVDGDYMFSGADYEEEEEDE